MVPSEAVFIVDVKHEKTAITEANEKGVPVFAILDSNVNPDKVAYGIPSNDDAIKAIELMVRLISEAISEGLKRRETQKAEAAKAVAAGTPVIATNANDTKILTA